MRSESRWPQSPDSHAAWRTSHRATLTCRGLLLSQSSQTKRHSTSTGAWVRLVVSVSCDRNETWRHPRAPSGFCPVLSLWYSNQSTRAGIWLFWSQLLWLVQYLSSVQLFFCSRYFKGYPFPFMVLISVGYVGKRTFC